MFLENKLFHFVLIIGLGLLIYFNCLQNPFLWDDDILVANNIYVRNPSKMINFFTQDIGKGGGAEFHFYRPFLMLTYSIDHLMWKLNTIGYHLTNVLLHIGVALTIYWLVSIIFKDNLLSFLASIFFVAHPIHTEAVTYISGRADPLAAFFMLLSFVFFIKHITSINSSYLFISSVCYVLALLSKEYTLILPLLIVLYYYRLGEKKKGFLKQLSPMLVITFLYIILRITFLKHLLYRTGLITTTIWERVPGFFVALIKYIMLLIVPVDLHMEYGLGTFRFLNIKTILGLSLFVILFYIAFLVRKKNKLISFSILWFFISLFPYSNLFPLNAYMAEHWLYLSSLGYFLIISYSLNKILRTKGLRSSGLLSVFLLLSFYSLLAIRQNFLWKSPITFYKRILEYSPFSFRVRNNLGKAYDDNKQYKEAAESYRKALELNPRYIEAYNNLALFYQSRREWEESISLNKKIIEIAPNYAFAYRNLANAYTEIGNIQEAVPLYKKAIDINPEFAEAYNNLGITLYTSLGQRQEAIALFKKALEIEPDFSEAHNNLAVAYYYTKQYTLAVQHCDRAIKLRYEVNPEFLKLIEPYRK